jgi:hypothetical protein
MVSVAAVPAGRFLVKRIAPIVRLNAKEGEAPRNASALADPKVNRALTFPDVTEKSRVRIHRPFLTKPTT